MTTSKKLAAAFVAAVVLTLMVGVAGMSPASATTCVGTDTTQLSGPGGTQVQQGSNTVVATAAPGYFVSNITAGNSETHQYWTTNNIMGYQTSYTWTVPGATFTFVAADFCLKSSIGDSTVPPPSYVTTPPPPTRPPTTRPPVTKPPTTVAPVTTTAEEPTTTEEETTTTTSTTEAPTSTTTSTEAAVAPVVTQPPTTAAPAQLAPKAEPASASQWSWRWLPALALVLVALAIALVLAGVLRHYSQTHPRAPHPA